MKNNFSEALVARLIMLNDSERAGNELFNMAEECLEQGKNMEEILLDIIEKITDFDIAYSAEIVGVYSSCVSREYK